MFLKSEIEAWIESAPGVKLEEIKNNNETAM